MESADNGVWARERHARARYAHDGRGAVPREEALTSLLAEVIDASRASIAARAELFALEAENAANAAVKMAVYGASAFVLAGTAWLVLVVGIVLGLEALGLAIGWAIAAVVLVQALIAWLLVSRVKKLVGHFRFDATRRSLKSGMSTLRAAREGEVSAAAAASAARPMSGARAADMDAHAMPGDPIDGTAAAAGRTNGRYPHGGPVEEPGLRVP